MDSRIVTRKLAILRSAAVEELSTLSGWSSRTAMHQGPGAYAYDGPWKKTALPDRIPAGRTVFYRASVQVPVSARPGQAFFVFEIEDLEGQLTIGKDAYAGIDANHRRVPVPRRETLDLLLEFLSVPQLFCHPERACDEGRLAGVQLCRIRSEIEEFCADVQYAFEAIDVCPDTRRRELLGEAIEAALLAVDVTLQGDALIDEVVKAQRLFDRHVKAIAPDPEDGGLYAVGHSHIDTAWLWPIRETIRKCGRTFSTACRMLERYPQYYFSCSQPQLYRYTKIHYPEIYRQIKKWVKAGRWGTDGAMWVEPDCNITSGESLIRQILYGLAFFRREFGTRTRVCWLPDVFGYNASLPQILKGSGIAYFYTYKLHWQSRNRFPHSTFQWRGLDGSEVLAHIPWSVHAYNGDPIPSQLRQGWERHPQKGVYPELLFPYGWGDGGGGANDEMLGRIKRASRPFPGVPRVRIGTVNRFFADIEETNPDLPVWDGELYLETHRGVLTTQARMKRANRKSELLLRDAEILASMAKVSGRRVDTRPLREAWHTTCLHHFHDILPGSSIGQVYDEALADHQEVQETACAVVDRALGALLSRKKRTRNNALFVLNTVSWPRNDVVSAPAPFAGIKSLVDAAGRVYPVQADGRSSLIFEPAVIPPMGYAVLQCSRNVAEPGASFTVTNGKIETPLYRIRLDRDGAIRSLYDKVNKREVVAEGGAANDLQLFQDGPEREDAWNVHATYEKRRYPFDGRTRIQVVEQGPVRGVVRVTRTYRDSTIEQDLMIYARTPRIDFVTRVDWQDRQVMLKAAFPVAVRSPRATYEVQFGAVERPTHRNTSWDEEKFEVAAQRWADLSEAGYGVSLLNDCKYGHDTRDNIIRITLLRSTSWPDPNADKGRHEFTYSLFPHAGNWTDAGTVRRAAELNIPVRAVATATAEPAAVSFFEVEGPAVLDTVKPAEEGGGIVLRLYEPHGGRGEVRVRCKGPIETVTACNLVEEDEDEVRVREGMFRFSMKPFQVRTFRVARST